MPKSERLHSSGQWYFSPRSDATAKRPRSLIYEISQNDVLHSDA